MDRFSTGRAGDGKRFYGWVIVAASFFIITLSYGAVYSFGVFLSPLRAYFHSTSAVISGAYSLTIFMYSSCGIFAGWSVDRYGPKVTIVFGGLLLVWGLLMISRVTAIWQLYVVYGVIGAGMSTAYTPTMATISRWFIRRRGLALGMISMGTGVGPFLAAPLASYQIVAHGWQAAYLVLAGLAGLIIPVALLMKKSPEELGELPDGVEQPAALERPPYNAAMTGGGLSLREAVGTGAFRLLAGMAFLIGLGLQMVLAHIVAYSQSKALTPLAAAAVLSTLSGAGIIGRIVMGSASDVIGRERGLALCLCGEGIMMFWFIGASGAGMLFLGAALFGFFYGGHVPQLPALIGETLGVAHMGAVLGLIIFFWGLGGAGGPVIAGWLVDRTGSYASAFFLGGTAMLLAAPIPFMVKKSY